MLPVSTWNCTLSSFRGLIFSFFPLMALADDLIGRLFFKMELSSMLWQHGNLFSFPLQNDTWAWNKSTKPLLSVLEDDGGLWKLSLASEWKRHLLHSF